MKKICLMMLVGIIAMGCKKTKTLPEEVVVEPINVDKVDGIPDKNKVLLIEEEFNSNNNAWLIFSDPNNFVNYMKIEKGLYSFYNDGRGTMLNHSNGFNFDQSKDFEIETKFKATTKRYGFYWASNDASFAHLSYRLEFDEGKMDFVDIAAGFVETYIVRDKIVESTENAVIKIRKVKNKYYFFLNQTLVYEGPYLPSKGQSIGYMFMGRGNFDAEYMKISRIDI
jgi:hypothetical protein